MGYGGAEKGKEKAKESTDCADFTDWDRRMGSEHTVDEVLQASGVFDDG